MREIVQRETWFRLGREKFTCDICGRNAVGVKATVCPTWEDYGFVRLRVGLTNREYLVCREHRDAEILKAIERWK